jgi:hypothetical protein
VEKSALEKCAITGRLLPGESKSFSSFLSS